MPSFTKKVDSAGREARIKYVTLDGSSRVRISINVQNVKSEHNNNTEIWSKNSRVYFLY